MKVGHSRSLVVPSFLALCSLSQTALAQCDEEDWLGIERLTPPGMPTFFGQLGGASLAHEPGFLFVGTPVFRLMTIFSEKGEVAIFEQDPAGPHEWSLFQTILGTRQTFGAPVAADGDVLAIGDPGLGILGAHGTVGIYTRTGSNPWAFATFIGSSLSEGSGFGSRIALDDDVIAIGASVAGGGTFLHGRDVGGAGAWGLIKQLNNVAPSSMGMSADVLVIGYASDAQMIGGMARVFLRDLGGPDAWGELTTLTPPGAESLDAFGTSVAVAGELVVIGAKGDDDSGANAGAAYVFERSLGGPDAFGFSGKLLASDGAAGDELGISVAVDSALVAVGTSRHDHGAADIGAAYVFQRAADGPRPWVELHELLPSDPATSGNFGEGLAAAGDDGLVFVGAPLAPDAAVITTGAAYVFGPGSAATAVFRNDASASNPASYSATPALLGDTLRLTVDLSSTGHTFAFPFGFDTAVEIPLGSGQVLLCLDVGGSGELLAVPGALTGPLAVFDLPVPNVLSLCGFALSTQALHFGGAFPFALSNARDLVVGTGV